MRRAPTVVITALLAALLAALAACAPTQATEVMLIVDVTASVRARMDSLSVDVSGATALTGPFENPVTETEGPPVGEVHFPARFALVPKDGDATRFFQAIVTAHAGGADVAGTVVRSRYAAHRYTELHVLLDDVPCRTSCADGETCRLGACVSIFVAPQADAGVDSATDMTAPDLGPGVDGGDGGADAGGCTTDTQCSDGDACDGVERCSGGACLPGIPVVCADSVPCTQDACNTLDGICTHTPVDTLCTDGSGGTCTATGCQYTSCDATSCHGDPTTCTDAACAGATCVYTPRCEATKCCAGVCGARDGCGDANDCTVDTCMMDGCHNDLRVGACDDGNPCTVGDACGVDTVGTVACIPGPVCDDGNPCTDDACASGSCTHTNNTLECGAPDPTSCTSHICHLGACTFIRCPAGTTCCPSGGCARPLDCV